MNTEFTEVRCTYFCEERNLWLVDAWRTDDDNEEGEVVALINPSNYKVEYTFPAYSKDELVLECVKEKLKELVS